MLTRTRNTMAAVEESGDRLATAVETFTADLLTKLDDHGPNLADVRDDLRRSARAVQTTCATVREAAEAHRSAMATVESLAWGVVAAFVVWYSFDTAREVWDGLRHG